MNTSIIISTLALIVSMASTAYSYRLSRHSHDVSTYYGVIHLFGDIDKVMIEYPEIRPYFYQGKVVTSGDLNGPRVKATAELVLDVFEWVWHRQEKLSLEDKDGWEPYILEVFSNSPALREHYAKCSSWYPATNRLLRQHALQIA